MDAVNDKNRKMTGKTTNVIFLFLSLTTPRYSADRSLSARNLRALKVTIYFALLLWLAFLAVALDAYLLRAALSVSGPGHFSPRLSQNRT